MIRSLFDSLKNESQRYTIIGVLFGLLFPIFGTLIRLRISNLSPGLSNIYDVQRTDPLLWIIDTAPVFLGLFAAIAGRRQDYLQQLNNELNLRQNELETTRNTLEIRVNERTAQLQNTNRQTEERIQRLQAVSEISQSITANVNLSLIELLSLISRSVSDKTGYYHTGIFLLDENREFAVLRAANGFGGTRMLERRHQLKVGSTGIVGYVSQSGRPRIALDTGSDAVFFNNPDLPGTRSEMALPLKVGTQILGVLDVQSTESSAFSDEDVSALSTLANQIAIIIQNLQLREGAQPASSFSQFASLGAQLGRKDRKSGFSYSPDGTLSSASKIDEAVVEKTLASGEAVVADALSRAATPYLAVPVKLRDQIVGIIHIESADSKRKWSEDEVAMVQAVSERAALALENASLFEAAEQRAVQEQVIAEVTARIGESNDMDRILQTTIQELGRTLGAARAYIQLGASSSSGNGSSRQEEQS